MKTIVLFLLLAACRGAFAASAGSATAPDSNKIHAIYLDGDFDQAIALTEGWLASRRPMSHSDSVFALKHLGVMYAARNETREKGKYYMLKLLEVEPTARILDMYASDMIYMIFKNIREEYEANRVKLSRAEAHLAGNGQATPPRDAGRQPAPAPETRAPQGERPQPRQPRSAAQPAGEGGGHALYWIAGAGAVAVAAGVAAYVIFSEPSATKVPHDVQ